MRKTIIYLYLSNENNLNSFESEPFSVAKLIVQVKENSYWNSVFKVSHTHIS